MQRGAHLKAVQGLLGHATIAQTADTYSHVSPQMLESFAAQMDLILSPERAAKLRSVSALVSDAPETAPPGLQEVVYAREPDSRWMPKAGIEPARAVKLISF